MNYKITNGKVLSFTANEVKVEDKTLYIKGDKISFEPFADGEKFETVDAKRRLIMPGLINMHSHAYMTSMRNYADDVGFEEWLFKRVMPIEDSLPLEDAYWTSLFAFIEMFKTGTTSFVDMHMYVGQSPKAAKEAGIRAFIGRGLVGDDLYSDPDGDRRFKEALTEKDEYESEKIKFLLAPHAIYSASVKLLEQVNDEAKKRGMRKEIHLSEGINEVTDCLAKYGKTPVALLNDIGFLDDETILAHCVQMRDDDLDIIKASGAHIVTNPASNAKLGNGFAPVSEIKEKGINLCLGTDGVASNNTLNMFREMGLLSLIHKGIKKSPVELPADYVLRTATVNGAKALGMENQIGNIVEGAKADIIFVDLDEPSLFPNNNMVSSLCYSANGSEVRSVMIGGEFVMKDDELLTLDKERIYYEVQKVVAKFA